MRDVSVWDTHLMYGISVPCSPYYMVPCIIITLVSLVSIKTLLYRGYTISSNYVNMHVEFDLLNKYFFSNGYLLHLIETQI